MPHVRRGAAPSRSQGAQRILTLLQQPDLKAQLQATKQTFEQLDRWSSVAESEGQTPRSESIQATVDAYLDGEGLPEWATQEMQHDVAQAQQRDPEIGKSY